MTLISKKLRRSKVDTEAYTRGLWCFSPLPWISETLGFQGVYWSKRVPSPLLERKNVSPLDTGCPMKQDSWTNLRLRNWVFATNSDFSNSYNLATHSLRPLIFQTINSVRSNNLSLNYKRFRPNLSLLHKLSSFIISFEYSTEHLHQT